MDSDNITALERQIIEQVRIPIIFYSHPLLPHQEF